MSVYLWGCIRVVCTSSYAEKLCVQALVHRACVLAQFPRRQRCYEETEGKTLRKEAFCFRSVREEGSGEGRGQEPGGPRASVAVDVGTPCQVLGSLAAGGLWRAKSMGRTTLTDLSLCFCSIHWALEMGALLGAPSPGRGRGHFCCARIFRMVLVSPCAISLCTHPSQPCTAA